MPASAAPSPSAPVDASHSAASPKRLHLSARLMGWWPTGLVVGLLAAWVLWLAVILTHPLHPTTPSALIDSVRTVGVDRWAFVEPVSNRFSPFLTDPIREGWRIAQPAPAATAATASSPASQTGWIAWKDYRGTHVAQLDGSTVTVTALSGQGWSSHAETRDSWPSVALQLPSDAEVHDVGDLWNGSRLLGPEWLVPALSVGLAIALLWRQPRFRTRWGWFWILGAPLGIGFVWMLLREQLFGARPEPETRPGGWSGMVTALLLCIPAQIVLSAIVPNL